MFKRVIRGVWLLAAVGLAACHSQRPEPPAPRADASEPTVPKPFSPVPDPSLPSASIVLAPAATATAKDDAATRPKGDLTRAEESSAMPKAGQTNNHSSTALDPKKPAGVP